MLADGSEYRGDYGCTVGELVRFHRPRLEILADAGPDVLALETVPDAREAEALLTALDGIGVPAWLSFTVANGQTRAGQSLTDAFGLATGVDGIIAVGVNCCAPKEVAGAIGPAAATGKPVVAYPNSGEDWDARTRSWIGGKPGTAGLTGASVGAWLAGGVRLVGGCCRVSPTHIGSIAAAAA
jgi:homocysteine S-methyltransferase